MKIKGDKWEVTGFGKRDKMKIVLGKVIKIENSLEPCERNGLRPWRLRLEKRAQENTTACSGA